MKNILQNKPLQIAMAVLMSGLMAGQTILAADNVRSANRNSRGRGDANVNANRNANVNVNRNANVNVNRDVNVNVNRDVDVNVHRHGYVHVDVDHHHGGFWAGVGTAIVVGAIVASIPPTRTVVIVSGTSYYYASGVDYVQGPTGYTVIGAPVGAI